MDTGGNVNVTALGGLAVNLSIDGSGAVTINSMSNGGSGYSAGGDITILGSEFGGSNVNNLDAYGECCGICGGHNIVGWSC